MNKKKLNKNLNIMYQDMLIQKKIYKASSFWIHSLNYFLKILKKNGIKNFRREKLATNYFVPLYNHKNEEHIPKFIKSYKKNNFSKKMNYLLDSSIDGSLEAFSDYRVFKGADNIKKLPSLHKFSESKFGNPIEQFKFDDKLYSRSALNYLLGLVFLKSKTKNFIPKTVLEIGGGFGTLGEILKFSNIKNFKYINVDLPPVSYIAEQYLIKCFGSSKVSGYFQTKNLEKIQIANLKNISTLCSWQIEKLHGKIDLFVNFISFQEMEPEIVKNYLDIVSKLNAKYILLRNIREGKQLKTKNNKVGVNKKITHMHYKKFLKKKYRLLSTNIIPFAHRTHDGFHSELYLFEKK
jgi:putative sugar O-methyltransferase